MFKRFLELLTVPAPVNPRESEDLIEKRLAAQRWLKEHSDWKDHPNVLSFGSARTPKGNLP